MIHQPIAVMASGHGTNLAVLLEQSSKDQCPVEVRVVISNKFDAPALRIARDAGVPTVLFINPKEYPNRIAFDKACAQAIKDAGCQWVVLAGYMRILSSEFVKSFENQLINIHPSLLPAFAGADGAGDALAYGAKVAGCTVHVVNEEVDGGPILAQAVVPVLNDDTRDSLHARIQLEEYKLYPETIRRLVEHGYRLDGRRVIWND